MKNLVWLASYPKSGNTWVRAVLTAYLTDLPGAFDLKSMDSFTESESLVRDYVALSAKSREQLDDAAVDGLRKRVQQLLTQRQARPFWVKTHNANLVHRGQRLIFPEFTRAAVYIVRNPLDVVDSLADHSGRTIDQAILHLNDPRHVLGGPAAVHVKQYVGAWSQHVRSWRHETEFPVLLVRYEDLQTQTFASFERLLRFLEWQFDGDRLRRALACTAFSQLQAVETQRGFAERNPDSRSGRFFRRGQSHVWGSALRRNQAELVLAQHAATMQAVGYAIPDLDQVYGPSDTAQAAPAGAVRS